MNKLNKYCSLAVIAALAGGAFTSCDDSKSNGDFEKYPGEVGGDIYFPANAPTQYDLETAGGEFSVIIERNIADETVTVPVSVKSLDRKSVV